MNISPSFWFPILDRFLRAIPLEGYRTIILGYLTTTLPAILALIETNPTGVAFYYELAMALAGPIIHYYRNRGKELT